MELLKQNCDFPQLLKDAQKAQVDVKKLEISTVLQGRMPLPEMALIYDAKESGRRDAVYLIAEVYEWAINYVKEPKMKVDPTIVGLRHNHLFHIGDFDVSTKELDALYASRPNF